MFTRETSEFVLRSVLQHYLAVVEGCFWVKTICINHNWVYTVAVKFVLVSLTTPARILIPCGGLPWRINVIQYNSASVTCFALDATHIYLAIILIVDTPHWCVIYFAVDYLVGRRFLAVIHSSYFNDIVHQILLHFSQVVNFASCAPIHTTPILYQLVVETLETLLILEIPYLALTQLCLIDIWIQFLLVFFHT